MVGWFKVGWHYYSYVCLGNYSAAFLTPRTIPSPILWTRFLLPAGGGYYLETVGCSSSRQKCFTLEILTSGWDWSCGWTMYHWSIAVITWKLNQQNVNRSESNTQFFHTLQGTSPVPSSTSRISHTLVELHNVLSDSARGFSSAPEHIHSY